MAAGLTNHTVNVCPPEEGKLIILCGEMCVKCNANRKRHVERTDPRNILCSDFFFLLPSTVRINRNPNCTKCTTPILLLLWFRTGLLLEHNGSHGFVVLVVDYRITWGHDLGKSFSFSFLWQNQTRAVFWLDSPSLSCVETAPLVSKGSRSNSNTLTFHRPSVAVSTQPVSFQTETLWVTVHFHHLPSPI